MQAVAQTKTVVPVKRYRENEIAYDVSHQNFVCIVGEYEMPLRDGTIKRYYDIRYMRRRIPWIYSDRTVYQISEDCLTPVPCE